MALAFTFGTFLLSSGLKTGNSPVTAATFLVRAG
jgi:hypothetical protein